MVLSQYVAFAKYINSERKILLVTGCLSVESCTFGHRSPIPWFKTACMFNMLLAACSQHTNGIVTVQCSLK